ncbi:MAG TPA: 50S ribosomal protein L22 [Bacteroidota bacterium]|nr:50S ribosomal protein L22 [Bacteroidota bacterium]
MLEARAVCRYINSSPQKMRLVVDLIRGRSVPEALSVLHYSPKHASRVAEKVLRSAISNFQNKNEDARADLDSLMIKEIYVDVGPTLKRMLPAPMGRAYPLLKRSNHLTVVVGQSSLTKKPSSAPKVKQPSKPSAQIKE